MNVRYNRHYVESEKLFSRIMLNKNGGTRGNIRAAICP